MADQIDKWLAQARMADGKPMSDDRLNEVFDLVKCAEHWKYPIEATVAKDAATADEIVTAVAWTAGGVPDVEDRGDHWYVTGAGYYEWIGS